jgi:tetratricopeptide (TPR) repeat protein
MPPAAPLTPPRPSVAQAVAAAQPAPDLTPPAHERNPPAMTLPSPLVSAVPPAPAPKARAVTGWQGRIQTVKAWLVAQDSKLHGRRISAKTAIVLVALAALQGLLIVTLYAGARRVGAWFSEPSDVPERPVAAAPALPAREAKPATPNPDPTPNPTATPAPGANPSSPAVLPAASEGPDGSGRDVPDCSTLLADNPPHKGHYPGAALQQVRAGRAAIVRGDLKAAQSALCRAERWDDKNPEIPHELAIVLLLARDGADAAHWARRAVELDPRSLKAKDTLGDALARVGAHREAIAAWLAAARLDSESEAGRRALLGREMKQADRALRGRNLVIAERYFRRAAVLEPRSVTALVGLSYVLVQLGDVPAAVTWARRAVEVAPRSASARLTLGDALAKSGDKQAAAVEWREAGLLDPSNRDAAKRLRQAGLPPN